MCDLFHTGMRALTRPGNTSRARQARFGVQGVAKHNFVAGDGAITPADVTRS